MILIAHKIREVREIADRVTVLIGLRMFRRTDHGGSAPVELGVDDVVVGDS